ALTWPYIVFRERDANRISKLVRSRIAPTGSTAIRQSSAGPSTSLTARVGVGDLPLRQYVVDELADSLVDIFFRRCDLGWRMQVTRDDLETVANSMAGILDWDSERVHREVEDYIAYAGRFLLMDIARSG